MNFDTKHKHVGTFIGGGIYLLMFLYELFGTTRHGREVILSFNGMSYSLASVFAGAVSGFVIQNYFVSKLSKERGYWGAIIISIAISPEAFFLGVIFSQIGGEIGLQFGKLGLLIGLCSANVLVIIVVHFIAACIGALLSTAIGSLLRLIISLKRHQPSV
jgi:hypothetical protein